MKKLLGFLLVSFLLIPFSSWADPAAMNNGAYGVDLLDISKGQESKIRLEKEQLSFKCGKKYTEVDAKFWFKNTDSGSSVTQMSGFPDPALGNDEPEEGYVSGRLEKLKSYVDGKLITAPVRFSYVERNDNDYWVPSDKKNGQKVGWYTIQLTFPAGGQRVVEYRYKTKNGFFEYEPPYYFEYILYTGATWNGTIGELTADVELENGLKTSDMYWSPFGEETLKGWKDRFWQDSMLPPKEYWKFLDDRHLQLTLRDFKPKDNKALQRILIESLGGCSRKTDRWEIEPYDRFKTGKDADMVYRYFEDAGGIFLEVSPEMVSRATGGRHLADYLKPGDVVEYSGTYFVPGSIRVADPQKDSFKIIKKH